MESAYYVELTTLNYSYQIIRTSICLNPRQRVSLPANALSKKKGLFVKPLDALQYCSCV